MIGSTVLAACSSHAPDSAALFLESRTSRLAFISALQVELEPLLDQATIVEQVTHEGFQFHLGDLNGARAVFLVTGPGFDRAAFATEVLIDQYDPGVILFSGVAGGIDPIIRIGDVSIAERWGRHDLPEWQDLGLDWIFVEDWLITAAEEAARRARLGRCPETGGCLHYSPSVRVGGSGVTGERFIGSEFEREQIWEGFYARSVDMQTFKIAQVAEDHGVPFIAMRGISDLAGRTAGRDYQRFLGLASYNAAVVTIEVAKEVSRVSAR